ncbi:ThiF family adenylyltransferase [uncultured Tenacibaculum sp.]|uniref:E2/UBC family protein n=1 Tax=uncultured Tenacibaculum sp. TaxID=174713 RepID=UPI00261AC403|nr:ThiF family adenylyltransferase [uncultured Tenacibaculum sp.]
MSDYFEQIRNDTYTELKSISDDEITVLTNPKDANFLESDDYLEVWEVKTGLYDSVKSVWLVDELTMYIALGSVFPLEPAKIYYDKNDFEKLGYIPHSSFLRNDVCVYDEFVIVDESNPTGILLDQLGKAKKTLIEGLKGDNLEDFEDEFVAYWNTSGNYKDKLLSESIYSVIDKEPENYNSLSLLTYSIKSSEKDTISAGILYNKEEDLIQPYKQYFESLDYSPKEYEVFLVKNEIQLTRPPFSISCFESLKFIKEENQKNFRNYFNKSSIRILVFGKTINGEKKYFGWSYPDINSKIKGFRPSQLTPYNITFKKGLPGHRKNVKRFSSDSLTEQRLIKRTASEILAPNNYKFLIAGIGSVGSNLVGLLNNLNNPEFTLIDNDKLSSENIKRHLLGFHYLNQNKALAVKTYLKHKLPSQKIQISESSMFDFYNHNKQKFNEQDYIFLCLGKLNLEKWFIKELSNGNLKKPTFILWVEPYLIGAQLLYFHPDNLANLDDLFTDVYKYKFSIISPEEFEKKRDLFTLKESGCQTTYSPYSSAHLSLFLSAAYIKIVEVIENGDNQSLFYSWVGDIEIAKKLNVNLAIDSYEKYSLIENTL